MLWVKRGGYLIVETGDGSGAQHDGAVTGTIVRVLYKDDIRTLKRRYDVWCGCVVAVQRSCSLAT